MLQLEQVLHNRYQLKQKLGDNPMHQTWLAKDLQASDAKNCCVVVKLLVVSGDVQWDDLKLFEREAQVLRQLNHPRIPKYRDYFCIDDQLLWFGLVEEFIPGTSLKEILALGKKFTQREARQIAADILKILIYLHGLNPPVLHRDIKPSNLILGKDKRVYLVDFGSVQDRAAAEGATFTVVGTYGYIPLEQFGGRATPASDLYALGATLIHLLTGIAPADLPYHNSRLQFSELVSLNPGFIRWLEQLTQPNPEQRISTAKQALKTLKENHAASTSLIRSQPKKSRIQLKKSPAVLEIKIPPRGMQILDVFKLLGLIGLVYLSSRMVISSFNPLSGLFWLIVSLVGFGWWLFPTFRHTYVYFDTDHFEITWKIFGLVGRRQQGRVSRIDQVCRSEIRGGSYQKAFPGVTIAVGVQEYTFTAFDPALTEAECHWLIQEIKTWLGLN
ncbi:MAG TPA: serine/threonine-protein kinase [Coleofasciculaceae cyanobacterium]|jgi:serine/threonine protein kinase